MPLSPKQRTILKALREREQITLAEAVRLVGRDLYANAPKHVGTVLSRLVARGLVVRIKPGLYRLPRRKCAGCDRFNPEGHGCACGFYEP